MASARRSAAPRSASSRSAGSRKARRQSGAKRGFESRPWGGFENIVEGVGYKVKRLVIEPGHRISLQRHRFRAEHWVVVEGTPRVIIEGRARRLKARGAVDVPRGAWHRIENPGRRPVVIIEVQHGPYLGEDDIIRKDDDYGR
jgi:mannose-6-phosphate isomerase-like protein (cupin superfamily)